MAEVIDYIDKLLNAYVATETAKVQTRLAAAQPLQDAGSIPTVPVNPQARASDAAGTPKDKTFMYVAIGAAILLVGIVVISGKK